MRYNINQPTQIYTLPTELTEISGISYYKNNQIACIQDEKGLIFLFDIQQQKITGIYEFAAANDYEGIEIVGNTAYVLQSNGDIYEVQNFTDTNKTVKQYKTPLKEKNDTEGLAYSADTNSLLIACKEKSHIDKDDKQKDVRAVYRYSLDTHELDTEPAFVISLKSAGKDFKPSAAAIEPGTGNLYIVSSVDKQLAIIAPDGQLLQLVQLPEHTHQQPEGICFAPDGTMYISNEGDKGKGVIVKFAPIN